ncbi:MAG: GAF domain-containing protein [Spirochaetes bacterium]|nr:GAF domain-containing protein [Spirochaetota bacterium]
MIPFQGIGNILRLPEKGEGSKALSIFPGSFPYALPLFAIACLTGGIAVYAFRRSRQAGAITFGWLVTAMAAWSACYALELLAPTLAGKVFAGKLEYIGIASTPVLWLLFALEYTGHKDWLTPSKRIALFALPVLTFGLTLTNEFHHLIYTGTGLDPQGYPALVVLGHGMWFWINVTFAYCLVLAGVTLYLFAYFQAQRPFRQQMTVMVLGSIVPLAVNAIRLFTPIPLHGFDLTPFTFAFSGVLLSIGLFRFSLIDLTPIAAPLVMENLHDAVIVIDNSKRVVNMNPTARRWLGVGNEAIGQSALNVLRTYDIVRQYWDAMEAQVQLEIGEGEQRRWLYTMISPLRDSHGKILGRVIVARDNTREQTLLISEKIRFRQMELLNSITRASLEVTTFREMLQTLANRMGEFLDSDGIFITLWDESEQETIPGAAYGELREIYPTMKFDSREAALTESVLQAGHSLAVDDVFNTPYMSANIAARFPGRSFLALPLIAHGQKLGAALISFDQPHHFTEQEIAIGEQAAAQIALALNKAQLLDNVSRRVVQMGLIQEVSKQMAESLDETEICQKTVDAMVDNFGYDETAISLLVEGNKLELVAIGGTKDMGFSPGFQQNVGHGIMGHVAETREQYFTKDITQDPYYYHPRNQGIGAVMAVPMLHEEVLMGVLYIQSAPPHTITPDDMQILQTIASHLVTAIQKARFHADINEHLMSMTALQSVTQTVNSSLELDNIFKTVVQLLKESYGYSYVSIYLLEDSILRLGAQAGYPEELVIHEIPISAGIGGRTVRTRQTQFVRNVRNDPSFLTASSKVESEICIPLLKNDNVLGVLNIESNSSRPLTEKDIDLLTAFANPVALAIDNARLHAEITSLALTDGMTGLVNRRAFDQIFDLEIARAVRYPHQLALIMIDIDSFKVYNDTYGHPAGDERIKAIARILLANVRDPDIAARYGGEEFVIILPHTAKAGAMILAERLRESAEALSPVKSTSNAPIAGYTLSLGVASFPEDSMTPAGLLFAADNAELTAKRLGKNRICAAGSY